MITSLICSTASKTSLPILISELASLRSDSTDSTVASSFSVSFEGPAVASCGVFAFPAEAVLRRPFERLDFAMTFLLARRWINFLV